MLLERCDNVDALRKELEIIKSTDSAEARTMPSAFYTLSSFHELEKEEIFRKEWVCLSHVGEIPNTGDYFTSELIGEQIIASRDKENQVHVLSNVCRHRGNLVAQGKGNKRSFVCVNIMLGPMILMVRLKPLP